MRQPGSGHSSDRRRPDDVPEPMMDIDGVAALLNTNVRHIRRLVQERRMPHYKVGAKLRFDRREILDWLSSLRVPARAPDASQLLARRPHAS